MPAPVHPAEDQDSPPQRQHPVPQLVKRYRQDKDPMLDHRKGQHGGDEDQPGGLGVAKARGRGTLQQEDNAGGAHGHGHREQRIHRAAAQVAS